MFKKLILGIGIAALGCCGGLTGTVSGQCGSGNCGQAAIADGGVYDTSASDFLQNVGTGQWSGPPSCADSCARPSCPALCCGPYISLFGGWSSVSEFFRFQDLGTITSTTRTQVLDANGDPALDANGNQIFDTETTTTVNAEQRFFNLDDDVAYGITLGFQAHERARMELEYTGRNHDFNSYQVQTIVDDFLDSDDISTATGKLHSYSLMFNTLVDLTPRSFNRFNVYAGAGVGLIHFDGTATTATNVYEVDQTSFGYQIIGGLNRTITRRLDLFGEYRYVVAQNVNVEDTTAGNSLGDFRYKSNDVFFGIRLRR